MPETMKRALTSAEVRAAAEAGCRDLRVPAHVRVTALAEDTARDLGVRLVTDTVTEPSTGTGYLEERVRSIVAGLVGVAGGRNGSAPAAEVRHVDAREVSLTPFPYPGPEPGQDVRVGDVVTSADGAPMAAGFLTLTKGSFPWTLTYDEIEYVVEGELHIGLPTGTVVGKPGDVLYIPKGTAITFGTPSWAKFLYVTFPADWEEGIS